MIRSAFVAVVPRPGAQLPPTVRHLLETRGASFLHFTAGTSATWSADPERLLIRAWTESSPDEGGRQPADAPQPRWSATEAGFAAVTGHVRQRGRSWSESGWAEAARSLDPRGGSSRGELTGLFTAISAAGTGHAVIVADEIGASQLFAGECRDYWVVGTTAALVAHLLSPDAPPARDAFTAAGLAHTRARVGTGTGFVGVRVLSTGQRVVITPEHGLRIVDDPPPWHPDDALRNLSEAELIDLADALLVDAVQAAATFPAEQRIAELTGGKDSRLVLAGILRAGVADAFAFHTDGSPAAADVAIASELAAEFGLAHDAARPVGAFTARYPDDVRAFVHATAGMNNLWTVKRRRAGALPKVRVTGVFGEPLRSFVHRDLTGPADVAKFFERRYGALELVVRDDRRAWTRLLREEIERDQTPRSTPHDLLDAFHYRNRVLSNFGIRAELGDASAIFPLAQPELLRAAFALGSEGRRTAVLHRALTERASPALARHRFAEQAAAATAGPQPPARAPAPGRVAPEPPTRPLEVHGRKVENWATISLRERGSDDVQALVAEACADTTNPAWEHIDRARCIEALGRFDALNRRERLELTGAATAAFWLGGADGPP